MTNANRHRLDARIHEFFVRLFGISALFLFIAVCLLADGEVESLAFSALAISFGLWLTHGPIWNAVMFLLWFVFGDLSKHGSLVDVEDCQARVLRLRAGRAGRVLKPTRIAWRR